MDIKDGVADLHMHTVASDGENTVHERIKQARQRGLDAIAITDHDRIPEAIDTRAAEINGVTTIAGVEIRAGIWDTKVEILGYFVDPSSEELSSVLRRARGYRKDRNKRLIDKINRHTGLDLSYEELSGSVEGVLGRPHLAQILVSEGLVGDISEAFSEFLGEEGSCYVPMQRVPYDEVIRAVRSAGGVPSLAHPGRIRSDSIPEIIKELSESGLGGIEVWYPYGDVEFGVKRSSEVASLHDLIKTGGSDCHGEGSGKFRIGEVRVGEESLSRLVSASQSSESVKI
jgi:predicted metal-dependent phosphoesterase TrpH